MSCRKSKKRWLICGPTGVNRLSEHSESTKKALREYSKGTLESNQNLSYCRSLKYFVLFEELLTQEREHRDREQERTPIRRSRRSHAL